MSVSYYQVGKINEFCSSGDMHILGLGQGKSWVTNTETGVKEETLFPRTIRYYGELEDFRPELGKATINLNSAYCGLKVVVDNMPNGILTWKEDGADKLRFNPEGISGTGYKEAVTFFTFNNVKTCWSAPTQAGTSAILIFTWQPDGGIAKKYSAEIDLKRNVMTVVKVELSSYDKEIVFEIVEEGSMTEDNPIVADPM